LHARIRKKDEEDESRKLTLLEKDQEIHLLKNFINSLKHETQNKDQNAQRLKVKLNKMKEENKQLNTLVQSHDIKKQQLRDSKDIDKILAHNKKNLEKDKVDLLGDMSAYHKPNESKLNINNISAAHYNNPNDPDDENLKEITVLMKKILDD
jgi:hypothetical protein